MMSALVADLGPPGKVKKGEMAAHPQLLSFGPRYMTFALVAATRLGSARPLLPSLPPSLLLLLPPVPSGT